MHIAIDVLAAIILLFFLLAGWHKGFLLSLLGIVRVVLAYGVAYFSGRYMGFWLGEVAHRPRLVTIPVVAGLTFVLITFAFHLIMCEIRAHHQKKEKEDDFHRPLFSSFSGGAINLTAGTLSLALLFWLGDLFMVGIAGTSIPGSDQSHFSRFSRRVIYETATFVIPKQENPSQVDSMARMISHPAQGMAHVEKVLTADSVQQLITDPRLGADLLSGDAERIQQNASLQYLFNDRTTLDELRELGLLSGDETKSGLCKKLATFGQNEKIQASIESLKERQLLSTDKITLLVRDPAFDVILAELIK